MPHNGYVCPISAGDTFNPVAICLQLAQSPDMLDPLADMPDNEELRATDTSLGVKAD